MASEDSFHNLQMLLGTSKNPHFEGQAYWGNGMAKGRIENLLISLYLKRRIRQRALRGYRRGDH
jgi:hypothetical protein